MFWLFVGFIAFGFIFGQSNASLGDRLPDFKECVKVALTVPISLRRDVLTADTIDMRDRKLREGQISLACVL